MSNPGVDTTADIWPILEKSDYWRRSSVSAGGAGGHKEWNYFCVLSDSVTLIANFSIMDCLRRRQGASVPVETARTAVLVRYFGRWHGISEVCADDEFSAPAGRIGAQFGKNSLSVDKSAYWLSVSSEQLECRLSLKPIARPAVARSVPLGSVPMHWFVIPRLKVSGHLRVGREQHILADCLAYHDHNWGRFLWGDNFAWEWGITLGNSNSSWSVVYYRITDRGRLHVISQGLLMWRDSEHYRTFQNRDLTVRSSGWLRSQPGVTVPSAMRLANPGNAFDIPQVLDVVAESSGDVVRIRFGIADLAVIGLPNDRDDGVTSILESHAEANVTGRVRGLSVNFDSPAVVEFNRAE